MTLTESYSYLFCHHSLNTTLEACGGTRLVKIFTLISSGCSLVALISLIWVMPKRRSIFKISNNKIRESTAKVTWANMITFAIKIILFGFVGLDIGVPKTKDDLFYSSFYADIIFLATSVSSAILISTFIYCRGFLKTQKMAMIELHKNLQSKVSLSSSRALEVSTEISSRSIPNQIASVSESKLSQPDPVSLPKISWKTFFIEHFPIVWISTLLLVGGPLAIYGVFLPLQRQFLLIRQIRSIVAGLLYIAAGILIFVLNQEFKTIYDDSRQEVHAKADLKKAKKGKSKLVKRVSETRIDQGIADPAFKPASTTSVGDSTVVRPNGIFEARSKAVYNMGKTVFALLMGAGPTVILSGGVFDIIFEKSIVYYGFLVIMDILGIVGMLKVSYNHFLNEKNSVITSDETAWTFDAKEIAAAERQSQGLSKFTNVTVF